MRTKFAASWLQRPPTSMPSTTSLHGLAASSSGWVRSLLLRAVCRAAPRKVPACLRCCPARVIKRPMLCQRQIGPHPVRDGFNLPVIVALELVEVEVGDPGVGCDSGPASLQILAAARCKVMPLPLKTSRLWTRSAVVAEGVKSATAPALAGGQRQGEPQTAEKKAEKMGGICGVGTVWDCGEKVGMWAGLGFHHCLAGRVDGVDDSISECNKACLAGWLLPAAGHGCQIYPVRGCQPCLRSCSAQSIVAWTDGRAPAGC